MWLYIEKGSCLGFRNTVGSRKTEMNAVRQREMAIKKF